ncbi:DNA mismatch repair endonuclease MutL [Chungangia koreensis]|uniref:DNA mismatch repair protein MutL n=1 Tax=Chungangia koreensis TaxID=752657 RepID=A0ABV8X0Y9_9LACT
MGKIQLLTDSLSNKIAAGEVVERPSSVVKELVENAIDAGSTSIEISLKEAGLSLIHVTDNGSGMDEEDASLAFFRHATSKISNERDLFRIRSLGFRGEALASIAAVSKIELWTSDGEEHSTKIILDGGNLVEKSVAPLRKGTDIQVAQLFFNTPARLKYVKTVQTELGHTIDLINRLSLCYPSIAFKLEHDGQSILRTSGSGDLLRVISDIYGMATAKKMNHFEGESADYKISGYASLPEVTRASKNYLTLFVNGRWVKNYAVTRAVIDAYHTFLPIERYPIVVMHIEGDPYLTDVNVHPAKSIIKLSKESDLTDLVRAVIRREIAGKMRAPEINEKPKKQVIQAEQLNMWTGPTKKVTPSYSTPFFKKQEEGEKAVDLPLSMNSNAQFQSNDQKDQEKVDLELQVKEQPVWEEAPTVDGGPAFPELEIVGQVHGTYIVAQSQDGFYMVDQHAAQERIKYEFYREKVGEVDSEERQSLLIPMTFDYPRDEALKLKEWMPYLQEVGVLLEEFGHQSFVVREHPVWFPKDFEREIIEEMIEQALKERKIDVKKIREDAAIMMSCKRSIKANHYLTKEDMKVLLDDLKKTENPFTCPHGRPVIVHFSSYELEKMFKRVM